LTNRVNFILIEEMSEENNSNNNSSNISGDNSTDPSSIDGYSNLLNFLTQENDSTKITESDLKQLQETLSRFLFLENLIFSAKQKKEKKFQKMKNKKQRSKEEETLKNKKCT
jgi:hypothetical protein